ncbi:protein downstream neighbor of son homolog [Archocentrus centrarchus]|uniref:protein downstream neighbor of son homolog n=1 Tax=Archocentrus centrarchus TaxID=63155 RepID=UPI0011EA4EDA|nr:protein downstream neighbor of Son [Archocentrus centrarchus]
MSEHKGYSPSFKRPAEILRMRRKRARSDTAVSSGRTGCTGQSSSSPMYVRPFSPGPLFTAQNHSGVGTKRRNPFANIENTHSPKKKLIIFNNASGNTEIADSSGIMRTTKHHGDDNSTRREYQGDRALGFKLAEAEKQEHLQVSTQRSVTLFEDDSLFEEEEEDVKSPLLKSPQAIVQTDIPPVCNQYPADWSLKTRVLFTSPLSLSWAEHLKAQEEAQGISQHCRAQFNPVPHSPQDPRSCSELRCAFQQNLVYWQHPSLPWLSLFPRINAERSFSGKSIPWAQDAALQQSLMREWSISLSSLYTLLKSRLCPYFYLCSYQFTVLFRAAGLGSSSITALISPTTRGLREAMKAEGIEFSLPLLEEQRKSKDPQNLTISREDEHKEQEEVCSELNEAANYLTADGEEHDVYNRDEDGSFSWLKEMGVQDKIKKPDSHIIQLQKEGSSVSLDHKPESVICVEGPHTFTLINFFINWKGVVASSGSQAGLPPTLLAPSAFRGATMHTLKGRSVNVRSQMGSSYQNMSSLEITGPVLPSSLLAITTLLQPAQKGNFSAALCTHTPTAVLNINIIKQQVSEGSEELSSCGLHPASIQQLQQPSSLGKTALTHITMSNYSYTWKN